MNRCYRPAARGDRDSIRRLRRSGLDGSQFLPTLIKCRHRFPGRGQIRFQLIRLRRVLARLARRPIQTRQAPDFSARVGL